MSDVENLRALLAEARVALQGVAAYDANPDVSWTLTKEDCRDALDHIDAALAEPVGDALEWQTAITKALSESQERLADEVREARRERDEARAEVERLQAELVRVARAEFDRGAKQGVDQALWASRTAQETAYRRGAEAMREAAAKLADDHNVWGTRNAIRALPVPEDKP